MADNDVEKSENCLKQSSWTNDDNITMKSTINSNDTVQEFSADETKYTGYMNNNISNKDNTEMHHKQAINKLLGVDIEEMKRNKALVHLGVSNDDARAAHELMASIPQPSMTKEEKLTGYTLSQMKRIKAIQTLGASEDVIADETAKALAALGIQTGHVQTSSSLFSRLNFLRKPRGSDNVHDANLNHPHPAVPHVLKQKVVDESVETTTRRQTEAVNNERRLSRQDV